MPLPKLRLLKSIMRAILGRRSPEAQIKEWPKAVSLEETLKQCAVPVDNDVTPEVMLYACDLGFKRPYYYGLSCGPLPITQMYDGNQNLTSSPEVALAAVVQTSDGYIGIQFMGDKPMIEFESIH